jgi:hypothetical protein
MDHALQATGRRNQARRLGLLSLLFGVATLMALPSGLGSASAHAGAPAVARPLSPLAKIHDGQTINHLLGVVLSFLTDNESVSSITTKVRQYQVLLNTSIDIPLLSAALSTDPLNFWGNPYQMPNGPDNLPPLGDWVWWVANSNGGNDTSNWSVDPTGTYLTRTVAWSNESFTIYGVSNPTISVSISPTKDAGTTAVGGGFVLAAPGYKNAIPTATGYATMANSLRPSLVRMTLTNSGTLIGWNSSSNQPILSFTGFDQQFQFAEGTGAQVMLVLPAGNWGDSNVLPPNTPLVTSIGIVFHAFSGFMITPGAMYALIRQIANHTYATGETVTDWAVGNEVPLNSTAAGKMFGNILNAGIAAAQVRYPHARVGSDDFLTTTYLPIIAQRSPGVGFLAFHWYQSWGICQNASGDYCAPRGQPNGSYLSKMFSNPAYSHIPTSGVYSPQQAQLEWYNLTGVWLPVINSETNLGASGGIYSLTWLQGTDPRIPNLVGAVWLGSTLIDSSVQNVSQITYFQLTSASNVTGTVTYPYGGFGFGMTNVTPSGGITYFAPYYVMKLWDQYIPYGYPGLNLTDSDYNSLRAYAVFVNGQVNVALVNRVNVPVNVQLSVGGHFAVKQVSVIDSRTFGERYNAATNSSSVTQSGVNVTFAPKSSTVTIHGYGVALVQFTPGGITGNGTNGTGNSSGSSWNFGSGSSSAWGSTGWNTSATGNHSGDSSSGSSGGTSGTSSNLGNGGGGAAGNGQGNSGGGNGNPPATAPDQPILGTVSRSYGRSGATVFLGVGALAAVSAAAVLALWSGRRGGASRESSRKVSGRRERLR